MLWFHNGPDLLTTSQFPALQIPIREEGLSTIILLPLFIFNHHYRQLCPCVFDNFASLVYCHGAPYTHLDGLVTAPATIRSLWRSISR